MDSKLPTVAIIDDDVTSAIILESMLRKDGIRAIKASGGIAGRELVKTDMPDLVLLDIFMPDENGFDTCRKLKDDPVTAEIPIIFMTSQSDIQSKVSGFDLGAVDYITKPYMPAEVLGRVRVHIRLRNAMAAFIESQIARLKQLTIAQQSILPSPADYPEAGFDVFYRSAHEAGGDFYDVLLAGVEVFDYVVADVSGHDLGSSLATSALKALIHQGRATFSPPMETLRMVNNVLASAFPEEIYVTLAYARLNRQRRSMTIINAGHPPGILINAAGEMTLLPWAGDVLGAFELITLTAHEVPVVKGDRILMYTDGLIEIEGSEPISRQQGMERLIALCNKTRMLSLKDMVATITEEIIGQNGSPPDDILLLGVEV
ncbi:MAG: fused response regulator/phosphatase [Desulfomonilia bacterium]|jgi:sigma-B regulation protein RsbU (phosphoserine phosphatase)